jgi:hypothetical protein
LCLSTEKNKRHIAPGGCHQIAQHIFGKHNVNAHFILLLPLIGHFLFFFPFPLAGVVLFLFLFLFFHTIGAFVRVPMLLAAVRRLFARAVLGSKLSKSIVFASTIVPH